MENKPLIWSAPGHKKFYVRTSEWTPDAEYPLMDTVYLQNVINGLRDWEPEHRCLGTGATIQVSMRWLSEELLHRIKSEQPAPEVKTKVSPPSAISPRNGKRGPDKKKRKPRNIDIETWTRMQRDERNKEQAAIEHAAARTQPKQLTLTPVHEKSKIITPIPMSEPQPQPAPVRKTIYTVLVEKHPVLAVAVYQTSYINDNEIKRDIQKFIEENLSKYGADEYTVKRA